MIAQVFRRKAGELSITVFIMVVSILLAVWPARPTALCLRGAFVVPVGNMAPTDVARIASKTGPGLTNWSASCATQAVMAYYFEHDASHSTEFDKKAFTSVLDALYWAVMTISTVGYGDATPVTPAGQALACGVAMFGVFLFALPAGILGSGFIE